MQTQQQTIALLVADKHSLSIQVGELEALLEGREQQENELARVAQKLEESRQALEAVVVENTRLKEETSGGAEKLQTLVSTCLDVHQVGTVD